jgi:hypothetical protein
VVDELLALIPTSLRSKVAVAWSALASRGADALIILGVYLGVHDFATRRALTADPDVFEKPPVPTVWSRKNIALNSGRVCFRRLPGKALGVRRYS